MKWAEKPKVAATEYGEIFVLKINGRHTYQKMAHFQRHNLTPVLINSKPSTNVLECSLSSRVCKCYLVIE